MSLPCAIYTRKSSEEGLEQNFNSLDAQREACEAFVLSQKGLGWKALKTAYDDGGFSGGNTHRPALQRLMEDIAADRVKIIVVVTQQFNTTTSMGRLTLNVLLSFAQFEREVTGERIRDKIAASKRKGLWMGGVAPMGYRPHERTLVVQEDEATIVREIFNLYLELGSVRALQLALHGKGYVTPIGETKRPGAGGGKPFARGHLYKILSNAIDRGMIGHRDEVHVGEHTAIIEQEVWDAVQALLKVNRQGEKVQAHAASPALLAGLVFDEDGNRLFSTHAQKGRKRYRSYVAAKDNQPIRVPAQQLERATIQGLVQLLDDQSRWHDLAGSDANLFKTITSTAIRYRGQLDGASVRPEVIQALLERVTIGRRKLAVEMKVQALGAPADSALKVDIPVELKVLKVDIPVELKRCGMAMRLVVNVPGSKSATPDTKLIALISRGQDWFERLATGRCTSVGAIADEVGFSASYVARVVNLAFLAPDIIQAIQRGEQPATLTIERSMKGEPLPDRWEDQRRALRI